MKISKQAFHKTSEWIKRNARPLEAARWEYLFENGSKERVIYYLSAYQNDDGGFGNGIEPDFWLPSSSPMATWAAGQILMEIDVDPNEQIVQSMISYLMKTPQTEECMWPTVLPENNDYAHAPWWHWREDAQKNWMYNPSAELAAFLIAFSPDQSKVAELGWMSLEKAVNHLMESTEMDRHEINNYQTLIKLIKPYEKTLINRVGNSIGEIQEKVKNLINDCVDRDVANWSIGYKALPLDFISHPADPFYVGLENLVEQNILFYIEQMPDEGTWDISWEWVDYPKEFAIARRYWKGILAVKRYSIFKAFGYSE